MSEKSTDFSRHIPGSFFSNIFFRSWKKKGIHNNKVAHTSAHYEEMKDLMAAEIFMTAVEYRKFQCIDHSTYSINNSSGKKPCKSGRGHIIEDLRKSQNTGPSHTNVEDRGDPFRTKHPECLDQYAGNRKCHTIQRSVMPRVPFTTRRHTGV